MAGRKKSNASLFDDKSQVDVKTPPEDDNLNNKLESLKNENERLINENKLLNDKILSYEDKIINKKDEQKNNQCGIINSDVDLKLLTMMNKITDIENKLNIILTNIQHRDNNQNYPTWEHTNPGGFGPVWS